MIAINLVYPLLVFRVVRAPIELVASLLSTGMIVLALATFLQARRLGPVGSGFMCPATFSATYLGPSLLAAQVGGLPLVFGMTIFASVLEAAVAPLLNLLRAIFPPEVSGAGHFHHWPVGWHRGAPHAVRPGCCGGAADGVGSGRPDARHDDHPERVGAWCCAYVLCPGGPGRRLQDKRRNETWIMRTEEFAERKRILEKIAKRRSRVEMDGKWRRRMVVQMAYYVICKGAAQGDGKAFDVMHDVQSRYGVTRSAPKRFARGSLEEGKELLEHVDKLRRYQQRHGAG